MAKCYKCGADIDADSLFCDQCGQVQYVCPNCHIVGKGLGKCCGKCGSKLVEATMLIGGAQEVVQKDTTSVCSSTVASPTPSVQQPTCLFCRAETALTPVRSRLNQKELESALALKAKGLRSNLESLACKSLAYQSLFHF